MKRVMRTGPVRWMSLCVVCVGLAVSASADQVEMQNGDRYVGKVLTLNNETLVLQNEVLGTVKLPRVKVAAIILGDAARALLAATGRQTNAVADPSGMIAKLSANSNLIAKVQQQFLAGAGDEAQQKFNEMVSGLLNGKLTVEDLRAQARTAAEQLRAHRKDLGDTSGWALDSYLAILDQFLGEDNGPAKTSTNSPPRKASSADSLEE